VLEVGTGVHVLAQALVALGVDDGDLLLESVRPYSSSGPVHQAFSGA